MSPEADDDPGYARRLGRSLRSARQRLGLSLEMVEATTGGEFKASVLGAYERGQRNISVARLHRLAQLYSVEVGRLLPADEEVIDLRDRSSMLLDLRGPAETDLSIFP